MKKSMKWGASLIITGVLLSGCGSSSNEAEGNQKDRSKVEPITIMTPYVQSEPPAKDSEVVKKFKELTGENIEFQWVANASYDDKLNVTLASGDLPEIIVAKGKNAGFVKSANAGAFWDLTDYLKEYPNLAQYDEAVLENSSINGKVYGIYRTRDRLRASVIVRKDWLEKMNMEMPESVDDLYEVAKAFTENDPDGNGKDDTTGIILPKWEGLNNHSPFDVLSVWFGAPNAWGEEKDGSLYPSFDTEEYLDSMKRIY